MPIDASIYGLIKNPQLEGPLDQYGKAMTVRNLVGQGRLQDMQLQQAERAIAEDMRLRDLFAGGRQPSDADVLSASPKFGSTWIKNKLEGEKDAAEIAAKRTSTMKDRIEIHRNALHPVNDQVAFTVWRNNIIRDVPAFAETIPPEFSLDVKRQLLLKGDELMKQLTPNFQIVDIGGKKVTVDTNPLTNPAIKGTQFDMTMSPGESARLGEAQAHSLEMETLQRQNLIDQGIPLPPQRGVVIGQPSAPAAAPRPAAAPQPAPQPAPAPAPATGAGAIPPGVSPRDAREIAKERARDKPKDHASLRSIVPQLQRMQDEASAILNDPMTARVTGVDAPLGFIPGTPMWAARGRIETLVAQTFANVITALRQASKSGGLVGNMSDREGARFETMVGNLSKYQNDASFRDRVQQVLNYAKELEMQMRKAYQDQYGEEPKIERSTSTVDPNKPSGRGIKFLGFE